MGDKSKIEWTDATWNPVTGCSKISPGCAYCYAERVSTRYGRTSLPWTPANAAANVVLHPDRLDQPLRWRRPRRVFVNSMSDLFHEQVPDEFIAAVFGVMAACPQHTFQILTKRPERMRQWFAPLGGYVPSRLLSMFAGFARTWGTEPSDPNGALRRVAEGASDVAWPLPNVWLGVSAENQRWADERIPVLLQTPAAIRFLSCEPLLGPVDLSRWLPQRDPTDTDAMPGLGFCRRCGADWLIGDPHCCPRADVHWVIVGGESGGPGDRRLYPISETQLGWVRAIRDQCVEAGVAFLFKQWGGALPTSMGREIDGRTWDEYPPAVAS